MKGKRGQVLPENVIFIVLNLLFLAILILFIYSKSGGEAILEEKYAKQIALIIDSSKEGMEIQLNMEDAFEKADKNNFDRKDVVIIDSQKNLVTVRLREGKGYSYGFFNDVNLDKPYPIDINNDKKDDSYRFKISGYKT
ncbi:hypothetical protein COU59_03780 [Candidatus Pacearchaeota archaeon CG10_big_fil_rev_8_21_14_0_10_34_12]|nr:MAG: hypothetical protein COU59_03780 [Candidatus Pacearchaeota archaeon CG10_big_fil_rev_8_21_14_0_10_34_12]